MPERTTMDAPPERVASTSHRLLAGAAHGERHGETAAGFDSSSEALLEAFVQRRIGGFPHAIAGMELCEIDAAVLEVEAAPAHFVDAAALFRVRIAAGV